MLLLSVFTSSFCFMLAQCRTQQFFSSQSIIQNTWFSNKGFCNSKSLDGTRYFMLATGGSNMLHDSLKDKQSYVLLLSVFCLVIYALLFFFYSFNDRVGPLDTNINRKNESCFEWREYFKARCVELTPPAASRSASKAFLARKSAWSTSRDDSGTVSDVLCFLVSFFFSSVGCYLFRSFQLFAFAQWLSK